MLERESVMTYLPFSPRSSAAWAAASRRTRAGLRDPPRRRERADRISRPPAHSARTACRGSPAAPVMAARRFFSRSEFRTGAHENGVVAVETRACSALPEAVALVVERRHALVERLVHEDAVAVLGRSGAISRSTAWIASLVREPARLKNTPPTFFSVTACLRPRWCWRRWAPALSAIAAICACSASAMSKAACNARSDALEGRTERWSTA